MEKKPDTVKAETHLVACVQRFHVRKRSNQCFQCVPFTSGIFCISQKNRNQFDFFGVSRIFYMLLWVIHDAKCAHTAQKTQTQTHTARCDSAFRPNPLDARRNRSQMEPAVVEWTYSHSTFFLCTSNIKRIAIKFACSRPGGIRPKTYSVSRMQKMPHIIRNLTLIIQTKIGGIKISSYADAAVTASLWSTSRKGGKMIPENKKQKRSLQFLPCKITGKVSLCIFQCLQGYSYQCIIFFADN